MTYSDTHLTENNVYCWRKIQFIQIKNFFSVLNVPYLISTRDFFIQISCYCSNLYDQCENGMNFNDFYMESIKVGNTMRSYCGLTYHDTNKKREKKH